MRRTTLVILTVVAAMAAAFGLLRPIRTESGAPAGAPSVAPPPSQLAVATAPSRTVVADAPQPVAPATVDFDAAVAKLVDLSLRGNDELKRGEIDQAKATDAEGAALVKAVLEFVSDYEARALHALLGAGGTSDPRAAMTRRVLERLLFFGLQKLAAVAKVNGRAALDAFLSSLLDSMLLDEHVAEVVTRLLVDQAYLGAAQEIEVMRLVELVPTHAWLAEPMRRLLLTLWHNMETSGARPRDSLETLALMLKDDTNPARRAAAIERLMVSGDRNLVDFVLRDIEEQRDARRAADLAGPAAERLPPELAFEVVQRLRTVTKTPLTLPAIMLAQRDGQLVRTKYEDLRAGKLHPELRADLVMGLGCNPSRDNLAIAKAAFATDPDTRVRCRALLTITGNAASALGEEVVNAALADREFCGRNGERLNFIVAALDNMARQGEREAVARLGRKLGERKDLAPDVRTELERLLAAGPAAVRPPARQGKG